MQSVYQCALSLGLALGLCLNMPLLGQSHLVTPCDCATVKYVSSLSISNAGDRVAYVVKAPDLDRNRNDFGLYVRDIEDSRPAAGRLVASGVDISNIQWIDNDNRIAMLVASGGIKHIVIVNVSTAREETPIEAVGGVDSFSMDASGNTVAYSVPDPMTQDTSAPGATPEEIASGYRVRYLEATTGGFETKSLYLRRRNATGQWSEPIPIIIANPFTHARITHLEYARNLSMSPDGKRLFLTFMADGIPDAWKENPWVKTVAGGLRRLETMVLYDVQRASTSLAFKTVNSYSTPHWSRDGRSFFVNAHSPVGSAWEAEDIRDNRISAKDVNMFAVNADSGEISEVFRHVPPLSYHDGPLFQTEAASIVRLHHFKDAWRAIEHIGVPKKPEDWFQFLASNGKEVMGVHETVTSPEELFAYAPGTDRLRLLTDLNPQLKQVRFASVERLHWTTPSGLNLSGLLFMPPDYVAGKRYPLVIQTKGDSGWFTCDSGANHDPSFAPQPIAAAGMMYLVRSYGNDWDYQKEVAMRPKGYPGGIGEAVQAMDIWENAVDMLDRRGMIDPAKVGIIGFSRTGWQVEFDLAHSRVHYAAATVADNVQYSLSDYWLIPWASLDDERMYGGPPYGDSLESWRKYSISFNLERIHTPLLMEEMGYGTHDDVRYTIPIDLAVCYEVAKGLARLGRPVEMYYYPDEDHQPDHPKARLASLTRNLDWYRFWLQGFEDDNPSKKDQYQRWRELRKLYKNDMESESSKPGHLM
jgi:dipeptidyl aminopeptidase/acylaminoacyl peptidase